MQDEQIRIISKKLSSGTAEKEIKLGYILNNDRIYRKILDAEFKIQFENV